MRDDMAQGLFANLSVYHIILDELANLFYISKQYLLTLFKESYEMTVTIVRVFYGGRDTEEIIKSNTSGTNVMDWKIHE